VKVYAVNHRKDTSNTPFLQSVPEQVQLGDTAYTLSACIYGDGSHFVSIVRDYSTKRLLFCDGMMNNAQFIDYKASSGAFPLILLSKELQFAYFVRLEYVTNNTNNDSRYKFILLKSLFTNNFIIMNLCVLCVPRQS